MNTGSQPKILLAEVQHSTAFLFLAEIQLLVGYEQWLVEELGSWAGIRSFERTIVYFMLYLPLKLWKQVGKHIFSKLYNKGQEMQQLRFQRLSGQRQWIEDIGVGTKTADLC